jgi:hypothetical protein
MAAQSSVIIQSSAAARPMAWAMGGVPASKRCGGAAQVLAAGVTSAIMPPPPRKGGIRASASALPQSTPTPPGPKHLWPEKA